MLKQIDYQGKLEEIAEKFQGRKTEVSKEVNKTVQQIVADIQKMEILPYLTMPKSSTVMM